MSARRKTPDVISELLGGAPPAPSVAPPPPPPPESAEAQGQAEPQAPPKPRAEALATAKPPEAEPATAVSHFVSFRLGKQNYALALEVVEKVLRMVAPVELPKAPPWVLGALNLHGEVVPVVDLGRRMGKTKQKPQLWHRLVVAAIPPRKVALMVDAVSEVVEVGPHGVEPATGALAESRLLAGIIRNGGNLVMVLDPIKLGSRLLSGGGE